MQNILKEIEAERARQDAKWGQQDHDPFKWCVIIGEELGEVNKAVCDAYDWRQSRFSARSGKKIKHYRTELIQVAAVAVSMIECLDRGEW